MEPQKLGNSPGSGPEVVKRQRIAKESIAGQCSAFFNEKCASYYDDNQFSILAKGRTLFHLSTLENTFIKILQ